VVGNAGCANSLQAANARIKMKGVFDTHFNYWWK